MAESPDKTLKQWYFMKWVPYILLSFLAALMAVPGHGQVASPDLTASPRPSPHAFGLAGSGEGVAENAAKVQSVPTKFIRQTEAKAATYARRITNKTEKTLRKLARWEGKIKALLEKASPETAQRLFGDPQLTFAGMLEQYQKGQQIANAYGKRYDEYRDRLGNTMAYLASPRPSPTGEGASKIEAKGATAVYGQLRKLDTLVDNTEAVQQFIKERKKQLIEQSIQYIGKSKYLRKINANSYYYIETLRNYRGIFEDEKKAEELAVKLLRKIPGFEDFLQRNSAVAGLFGLGQSAGGSLGAPSLAGLQTRASVTALIQNQLAAGGPGAQQAFTQNVQQAQAQLNQLKERIGNGAWDTHHGGDGELPSFKPNNTKTKTFLQRIEYTANVGFGRINPLASGGNTNTTADIALGVGYKLNDKSTIGVGASYKLGMGSLQRVRLSGQGIGLRSYVDWKLKKQFYVSGGYEMNWLGGAAAVRPGLTPGPSPTGEGGWQRSGLIGISKKMKLRTKWFKASQVQLLYDMLHNQQRPVGQAWVFRMGYSF
jgi:Autotransporter beta-domain